MSEVASLELRVTSDGVATADKRLQGLTTAGAKAEGAMGSMAASVRNMIGPLVTAGAAALAMRKVMAETIAYENLTARLAGVTGGAEEAKAAFDLLEKTSDKTIFTENQMTEAFLHLEQTGLDGSARALKAFANIASATGNSMDQLAEMTLAASMGIFRSMRSMGIRAVADGDKIQMTFKGVTTTIGNSAQEIQGYLVKIGETQFAGAAERQLDTMGGSVKKLGDAWGDLSREVGRSVIGDIIKTTIGDAATVINGVTVAVEALLYTMSKKPPEMSAVRMDALNAWIRGAMGWGEGDEKGKAAQTKLEDIFKTIDETLNKSNHRLAKYAEDRQHILDMSVNPDFSFDARQALADLDAAYAKESGGLGAAGKKDYEPKIQRGRDTDFVAMAKERDAELQKQFDHIKEIADLEEQQRELEAQFHEEEKRELEENARLRESLFDGLLTEEEELRQSYERRLADIEEYTQKDVGFARESVALKARLQEDYEQKMLELEMGRVAQGTQNAEALFGNLAGVAKNWGGEQSDMYRAMFAAQKAFAVASAMVASGQAMAEAMKLGWPAGIPAGIAAAAQVARAMSIIASANYSGAYDAGGFIPAGRWGIAGERGPEIVRGPAQVTSRTDTARALGKPNVTVVVAPDQAAAEQYLMSAAGDRAFLALARKHSTVIRRMVGA